MDKKLINRLAVTIEKINYLYRNIRKREENMQKLELALLKKYVTELYDGLVEVELELKQDGAAAFDLHPLEQREQQIIARVKEEEKTPEPIIEQKAPEPEPEIVIPQPDITTPPQAVALEPEEEPELIILPEPVELPEPEPTPHYTPLALVTEQEDTDEDETDDAATAYMHNFVAKSEQVIPETQHVEAAEEEIVIDDEGSVKTQILSDLQKSQILQPANEDFFDDTDETMAMELNDVLGSKQQKEPTLAEKLAGANGENTFAIGAAQRNNYINHLFGGDEEAYDHAIDDLATSKGYIEALTYVNLNLRYDYKWDDHDPIVREFLDTIKAKFLGKFSGS